MTHTQQKKNWLEEVYSPAPELDAVRTLRQVLAGINDKRNAISRRSTELERAKQKLWCKAVDTLDPDELEKYMAARDKHASFVEAQTEIFRTGSHHEDALTDHDSNAGDILEPAIRLLAKRTTEVLKDYRAAEQRQQVEAGLEPSDSPSLNPIKTYLKELEEAVAMIPDWGDGMVQSVWKRFNHLVKR
jgi:hypothetical protein